MLILFLLVLAAVVWLGKDNPSVFCHHNRPFGSSLSSGNVNTGRVLMFLLRNIWLGAETDKVGPMEEDGGGVSKIFSLVLWEIVNSVNSGGAAPPELN